MSLQASLNAKREWPLKLCDCYSYRDLKGNQRWWPEFCCTALLWYVHSHQYQLFSIAFNFKSHLPTSTNMTAGQVCTKVFKEKEFCCGLGCQGGLICLLGLPI